MKGFTLIELMISIVILAILSASGVNIFYRAIRGSSQLELRKTIDDKSRLVLSSVSRFVREGKVVSLNGSNKESCLPNGSATGNILIIRALDDISSTITVSGGTISSASALGTIVLNPDSNFTLTQADSTPIFTWYCSGGVVDRLLFNFRANSISSEGEPTATKDYSVDMILRNTGQ